MTPFKGIDVLLRAMERLGPGFDGHLSVHGANYGEQPPEMQESSTACSRPRRPPSRGPGPTTTTATCRG